MQLSPLITQSQKTFLTQTQEKSIAILMMPYAELNQCIEAAVEENPLLEAEYEGNLEQGENDLKAIIELAGPFKDGAISEEQETEPSFLASSANLEDYLLQQLHWEFEEGIERQIGEYIINNLDQDGFLHIKIQEIVDKFKLSEILVQKILEKIQYFEPLGVATGNIQECLIVQLKNLNSSVQNLAIGLVKDHFQELGNKRFEKLAKKHGVSSEKIREAVHLISSLEPRPARNFRPLTPSIYIQPDLYIRQYKEGGYFIETNKSGLPKLRISQSYRQLLSHKELSLQDQQYIKEKITSALNFIKSIEQRGETLSKVGEYILNRQHRFLNGTESSLAPMTLKEVAAFLNRNESTISRAISHKYIETPQGTFPLKFFFSHSASSSNESVSADSIEQQLLDLIENEDKRSPLSDQQIQEHFYQKEISLSRRTITKYRQKLDIDPSYLRKKLG